ncbi:MAG: Gfo/Idh/MocA family protein [Halosimplex sp.]
MLSLGLVGCGRQSERHANVVGATDGAELVGCADVDVERAREFAADHDVPAAYGSLAELVDAEPLDGLVIAAVPTAHPDLVETAIERGIGAVLCEKPMVVPGEAERARELRTLAEETDTVLMEGLMYRHHPQIQRALELVDEGAIGDVKYVHGQFSDYYSADGDNWRNDADLGGGSMGAKGCYMLDACNAFADAAPAEAVCRETYDEEFGVEIGETGTVVYENGVTAQFETNHRSVWREELKVCGTEGVLVVPHAIVTTSQRREIELQLGGAYEHEPRETEVFEFDPVNSYALQFENFLDCVRGDGEPVVSLSDSVANYELADALLRSTETDRVEEVS